MTLPKIFDTQAPIANASYDFYDLSARTGYKVFYGLATVQGYILAGQVNYSNFADTDTNSVNAELNFDVEFKSPQIIRGQSYLSFSTHVYNSVGGGSTASLYIKARVYKVSGAVETALCAEVSSDTITEASGVNNNWSRHTITLELTQTHFKTNDKLRLEIVMVGVNPGGSSLTKIFHDPSNSLTFTESSTTRDIGNDLVFTVPFKINL